MSKVRSTPVQSPGSRIKAFRARAGLSLDDLADRLKRIGLERRPSVAKLSRIENGLQPVTTDVLAALASITGIAPRDLRPDLAKLFLGREAA